LCVLPSHCCCCYVFWARWAGRDCVDPVTAQERRPVAFNPMCFKSGEAFCGGGSFEGQGAEGHAGTRANGSGIAGGRGDTIQIVSSIRRALIFNSSLVILQWQAWCSSKFINKRPWDRL
jgi:hypothetical protein